MRKLMILSALCLSSQSMAEYKTGSFPTNLEEVLEIEEENGMDASCLDQNFGEYAYCLMRSYDNSTRDVYVEAYIYLEPGHADGAFDTKEQILDSYLDTKSWPQYVERSELKQILSFPKSEVISDEILDNGDRIAVHHYEYTAKAPIIGRLYVTGTSTYRMPAVPAPGAAITATFKNTKEWGGNWELITPLPGGNNYGKGIKGQDANIHIVELEEGGHLVIYRTRIRLATTLALSLTYKSVGDAVEDILVGMFMIEPQAR